MIERILRNAVASAFLLASVSLVTQAAVITYSDSFESPTINPFWTVTQSNGTVAPSADVSHSGVQSAKFTSASGGQRSMRLVHDFGTQVQGTFSVWFYDYAPNQQTLYENIVLSQAAPPSWSASLGTQDFDAFCYQAYSNGTGPNGSCGSYPAVTTTTVPRTLGWHQFTLDVTALATTLSIDGSPVFSNPGNFTFDTLSLNVTGPFWRPDTIAYFDEFSMRATSGSPVPEPATALLMAPVLAAVFLMRRQLRQ